MILLTFNIKPAFSLNNESSQEYNFGPAVKTIGPFYRDTPDNDTLRLNHFTIATWFRTNQSNLTAPAHIVNKGGFDSEKIGNNMNYGIWLSINGTIDGGFETKKGKNVFVNSTSEYTDGKWHYVLLTYNGTFLRLDIDGRQVDSINTNGAIPDTGIQPLRIGANSLKEGKFFTGEIDEVRIWNNSLTDVDIDRIYSNATFNKKNQVLYLNFTKNGISDPIKALEENLIQILGDLYQSIPIEVKKILVEGNQSIPLEVKKILVEGNQSIPLEVKKILVEGNQSIPLEVKKILVEGNDSLVRSQQDIDRVHIRRY